MKNVMEECYKKYLEKQSVKFLVHCTHKAWIKLIDLNFYVHNPVWPFFNGHKDWIVDVPPEPSPPDTWAAFNVPISEIKDDESNEISLSDHDSVNSIVSVPSHDESWYSDNENIRKYMLDLNTGDEEEAYSLSEHRILVTETLFSYFI